MKLPKEIEIKKNDLIQLCRKHKVEKLYVFGSITKGTFKPDTSDIDFLIEIENIPPVEKGELLLKLWNELEKLFSRNVDLISMKKIKNPYLKKSIQRSQILIYDRAS